MVYERWGQLLRAVVRTLLPAPASASSVTEGIVAVTAFTTRRQVKRLPERWGRAARTVLLIAFGVMLGALGFKAYRLSLPTDGWSVEPPVEAPTSVEHGLKGATPLAPGDVLLGVNGVPYFEVIGGAVRGRPAPIEYWAGGTVTYTVMRGGQLMDLEVPLVRWTLPGALGAAWRSFLGNPMGGAYLCFAWLLAAFVFYRRPENRSARLLFLLESFTLAIAISSVVGVVTVADALAPGRLYGARLLGDMAPWLVLPPLALHFLLAFPAARPVRGWLLLAIYVLPWFVLGVVWLTGAVMIVPLLSGAYSLANLAVILQLVIGHGDGPERAQVRWLAFGFGLSAALTLLFWLNYAGFIPKVPLVSSLMFDHCLCELVYVACTGVALLRHRLFDIDVIVRRTLVYGGLTLGVIGFYVGLVGGLGRLLGGQADWPLALTATGVVALAFDPLRSRLQRAANRLVYGFRDEPYVALAQLGQRLEYTERPATALVTAARAVAEALRLPYVAVEVGGTTLASHGEPRQAAERIAMTRAGEPLGALVVSPRQGEERLPKADRGLLGALAGQVATAVHALELEADLERSRLASLNARDEARRALGSDLHDDVGHRLSALVRRAEAAGRLVDSDPEGSKRELVTLVAEVKAAALRVRSLAYQLHPPELTLLGLVGAIRERLAAMGGDRGRAVHLVASELGELPAAVELGVYNVVQEALANVAAHSGATRCVVSLEVVRGSTGCRTTTGLVGRTLVVEVVDDGAGFAPGEVVPGLGLTSMRQRADELGGTLSLDAPAVGGTRLRLSVPLPDAPPGA